MSLDCFDRSVPAPDGYCPECRAPGQSTGSGRDICPNGHHYDHTLALPSSWPNALGFCPICHAPGAIRNQRLKGDDICLGGHRYPTDQALQELPKPGQPKPETGWLIETEFNGGSPCWLAVQKPEGSFVWVHDSLYALRFSRQQDAESFIVGMLALSYLMRYNDAVPGIRVQEKRPKATEHQWG